MKKKNNVLSLWLVLTIIILINVHASNKIILADGNTGKENVKINDLPRATYKLLVEDYDFLKGEFFRGILYPEKYIKKPRVLWTHIKKDHKLLIAATKSRKYRLYIIIPDQYTGRIKELIRKRKRLYFAYTPVTIYNNRPVIRLVGSTSFVASKQEEISSDLARFYPSKSNSQWKYMVGENVRIVEYQIQEISGKQARGISRDYIPDNPLSERVSNFYINYSSDKIVTVEERTGKDGAVTESRDIIIQGPLKLGTTWKVTIDNEPRNREIAAIGESVAFNDRQYENVLVIREDIPESQNDQKFYAVTYYFYAENTGFLGVKLDSAAKKDELKNYTEIDEWFIKRIE